MSILPSGIKTDFADGENGWGAAVNKNWKLTDALLSRRALDKDLATPPATPLLADCYIVAAAATGAWNGFDNYVAIWDGLVWQMVAPQSGWRWHVVDESKSYVYSGSAWVSQFTVGTVYAANCINDAGVLTFQSKTTGTANIAQRLQAGTETALTTVFATSKTDGALPRVSCYGTIELNYANVGTSTTTTVGLYTGTGSPEGNLSARPGSMYLNRSGGKPYYKDSGTGNTGWLQL